ncbi:hypothetical protein DYB32_005518 [Aphanomyces invadans]|nr:hypothetical protein DYB32_005518 [Aphanomyces invadans]
MNKRRLRAERAARTERLSDEVAALQTDVIHLERQLLSVAQHVHSSAVRTASTGKPPGARIERTHTTTSVDTQPRTMSVESAADDKEAAEAQLRRFVACLQARSFSNGADDLCPYLHDNVELVHSEYIGTSAPTGVTSTQRETGLRRLLSRWNCFRDTVRDFQLALKHLVSLGSPCEWLASIEVTVQLTDKALVVRFPHVIEMAAVHSSFADARASAIAAKLVASPLHLDIQCHMWLDGHFKIVKLDVAVGWTTALLRCLDDADDVVWVLQPPRPCGPSFRECEHLG